MKKIFYAAMLLLGLGILLTACNNNGTSNGESRANDSAEKEQTGVSRSSASVEKEWTKEMKANGHIFFNTPYVYSSWDNSQNVYMLMMPYVFSNDGTRGILYAVYSNGDRVGLSWYAQYEVNGEHLLLTDIFKMDSNLEPYNRIMKIEHNNGRFVLTGRYPFTERNDHDPITSFYQESAPSDGEYYIALAETDRYCKHR